MKYSRLVFRPTGRGAILLHSGTQRPVNAIIHNNIPTYVFSVGEARIGRKPHVYQEVSGQTGGHVLLYSTAPGSTEGPARGPAGAGLQTGGWVEAARQSRLLNAGPRVRKPRGRRLQCRRGGRPPYVIVAVGSRVRYVQLPHTPPALHFTSVYGSYNATQLCLKTLTNTWNSPPPSHFTTFGHLACSIVNVSGFGPGDLSHPDLWLWEESGHRQ